MKFFLAPIALLLIMSTYVNNANAKAVSIMAYNVENFFDITHDAGTEDWTYLPLAVKNSSPEVQAYCNTVSNSYYKKECKTMDWSEKILASKIKNIARVIKSYSSDGQGPDVVVLEEIENINTINLLADRGLKGLYKFRDLTEGDDTRGISIGVISKYPIVSTKHHSTYLNGKKLDTRGIMEVTINVKGKSLTIFGNHWPSQGNPVTQRIASAELLSAIAKDKKSDLILAVGDFNTTDSDMPHPFDVISDEFYDSEQEARDLGVELMPGTYNYKGKWSSIDRIFVHKNSKILPNWKSFQILSKPWMMQKTNKGEYPLRFNSKTGEGFTDHLPILVQADL